MIRNSTRRMTVAQLKERMDQRFNVVDQRLEAVDRRFDAVDKRFEAVDKRFEAVDHRFDQLTVRQDVGFRSIHDKLDKLNAILQIIDKKSDHHFKILNEHEERLSDLETWRRTTRNIPG